MLSCPALLPVVLLLPVMVLLNDVARGEDPQPTGTLQLTLRQQKAVPAALGAARFLPVERDEAWSAGETAIIVCDVWDRHHCLNAVRRMTEFLPRMNQVLTVARQQGAVIIHAPSDCMPAYETHPARLRALQAPMAADPPRDLPFWCSKIASEEQAHYPIDQSDGGEDDDPAEHAEWAATLKAEGRNPALPWQAQNEAITIDAERDYISDRGDEVWNFLESRGARHVIRVGVHTNMCVLGRPFGLRQLVRAGKNVVLMRDLTDCMYNPKRWPWVDHFTGNDLIISHVERFVCPTISSEQLLGGKAHVSKYDTRRKDAAAVAVSVTTASGSTPPAGAYWQTTVVPGDWKNVRETEKTFSGSYWLRCSVRLPSAWINNQPILLELPGGTVATAWFNGTPLTTEESDGRQYLRVDERAVLRDGVNLLTLRIMQTSSPKLLTAAPVLNCEGRRLILAGRWQITTADDPANASLPLPAQFGLGPDVLFEAPAETR